MAEEQEATPPGRSPLVGYLMMGAMVFVVPLVLAFVVFTFVVKPMISPTGQSETHAEESHDHLDGAYPPTAMAIEFPETQSSVLSDDPELAAPVLIYRIAMVVDSPETAAIITGAGGDGHGGGDAHGGSKQVFFTAMLDKLHRNRTRSELSDPQVQETILKQARQEANNLLRKFSLGDKKAAHHEVLEVMYVKFGLIDI
jgi:hypothetical protein